MKKRIIVSLLCMVMIVGSALSLSSCFYAFGALNDIVNIALGQPATGGSQGSQSGPEGGQSGGSQSGGGGQTSQGGFYPGIDNSDDTLSGATPVTRALLSVVTITANFQKYADYGYGFYEDEELKDFSSEGSGVIYKLDREKGDAYIITNYHVVYNRNAISTSRISKNIQLYLYGQESEKYAIPATFVGGSLTNDIAVLRVEGSDVLKHSCAVAADLGDPESIFPTDPVLAIGNPEGLGISVTEGIISIDSEALGMVGADGKTTITPRVIRISAAINEGNSGVGLFDADGKLLGIVNAKKTGSEIDNIAYAIPVTVAAGIAENILYYCTDTDTALYKCMLGIDLCANVTGIVIDESGRPVKMEIVEIERITSAVAYDQLKIGDVITAITIDGERREVSRVHHVIDFMFRARVGSTVVLEMERGTESFTVTITVPESALTQIK